MGLCIYLEVKIIFCSIEHIDPHKQKHMCFAHVYMFLLLFSPGMIQAALVLIWIM